MVATINFDAIYQGDDWSKTIQVQSLEGDVVDLSGVAFRMQFRSPYSRILYLTLTLGNGIELNSNSLITLTLTEDQTRTFAMRSVLYDLELTWPNGMRTTVFRGQAQVQPDITLSDVILDIDYLADFSDPVNSIYGFLFNSLGFAPVPPDPSTAPFADFSDENNSQYAFLFNFSGVVPTSDPDSPMFDFTEIDNSGYIAILSPV